MVIFDHKLMTWPSMSQQIFLDPPSSLTILPTTLLLPTPGHLRMLKHFLLDSILFSDDIPTKPPNVWKPIEHSSSPRTPPTGYGTSTDFHRKYTFST